MLVCWFSGALPRQTNKPTFDKANVFFRSIRRDGIIPKVVLRARIRQQVRRPHDGVVAPRVHEEYVALLSRQALLREQLAETVAIERGPERTALADLAR